MVSQLFLLLIALIAFGKATVGDTVDSLRPCTTVDESYQEVLKTAFNLESFNGGSAVVVPAFGPEYAVGVNVADKWKNQSARDSVTVMRAGRSLFQSTRFGRNPKLAERVEVRRVTKPLSSEISLQVQAAFTKMLIGRDGPKEAPPRTPRDGESVQFNAEATCVAFFLPVRSGIVCGETLLDTQLPKTHLLVKLAMRLIELGKSPSAKRASAEGKVMSTLRGLNFQEKR